MDILRPANFGTYNFTVIQRLSFYLAIYTEVLGVRNFVSVLCHLRMQPGTDCTILSQASRNYLLVETLHMDIVIENV